MRVLLTGAGGFVGPYLADAIRRLSPSADIIATSKDAASHGNLGIIEPLDVTDPVAVEKIIVARQPTHVVHLAGIAATTMANANPEETWRVHLHGTLCLARTLLKHAPQCWLIHIGSGMAYGETAKLGRPLREDDVLAPLDEYSAAKASADLALGALVNSGLRCIRLRPFNHFGPGQSEAFVVPAFAAQIARIEAGLAPPVIRVGNLDARRDFLDVRDVAAGYASALQMAEQLGTGTILNIASGEPRKISEVLDGLIAISRVGIAIEPDPARQRANELPMMVGDAARARAMLQWRPQWEFGDTLAAVLHDCRIRTKFGR